MKTRLPVTLQVCLFSAVLGAGCSATQYNDYVARAGDYFHSAGASVGRAFTRATGALRTSPQPETMYARTNVNVRTGPGTNYDAIGALAVGESVPVVEQKNGWYWIRFGAGHGWVNGAYLLAGTPDAGKATAANVSGTTAARTPPATTTARTGTQQDTEHRIVAAEKPASSTTSDAAPEIAAASTSKPVIVREIGGNDVLSPSDVEAAQKTPTTSLGEAAVPTTTFKDEISVARIQSDQSDAATERDPGSVPGDASASAVTVAGANTTTSPSALGDAAALGGDVDVAGITFRWGMSPSAAAAAYGQRARRVEANGAVWLQAANVGSGVNLPVEWFDLRYCSNRLCGIHHVVNDVAGDKQIGDDIASTFDARYGAPTADFWTDFGYGRLRMRTWRTPSTRIRLSHQEAQTYVAIDYEPIGSSKPPQNGGTLARD